ncbi:Gypsy retrotransposon integrase-like protein 1 [Camponotus japonicus]
MIVAFLDRDHREWDEHLKDFRFAYNTAHHSSIGTSPAFLNLGRELNPSNSLRDRCRGAAEVEPRDPVEWSERMKKLRTLYNWVDENLEQAYRKQAAYYDVKRRDITFQIGDLVLKRHHVLSSAAQNIAAKLSPKFHGPFRIDRMLSPVVCELVHLNGDFAGKVHVQDLKPYHIPLP